MRKFSKLLEDIDNNKYYKITANVELIVHSESDGEAGYLADSILAGIEESLNYSILNIEETDERIDENKDIKK